MPVRKLTLFLLSIIRTKASPEKDCPTSSSTLSDILAHFLLFSLNSSVVHIDEINIAKAILQSRFMS